MAKDYYVILGVTQDESPRGIRAAFRELARKHHPDRVGPEGTEAFREIVEAYEVLSSPERRAAYDEESRLDTIAPFAREPEVEPLASPEAIAVPRAFATVRPSIDALIERFLRNFLGGPMPKSERPEALTVELVLTAAEAERGGIVSVDVPVLRACPGCRGLGRGGPLVCRLCDGTGDVETTARVRVELPPGISDREVFTVGLDRVGIRNLYLDVLVRVGRHAPHLGIEPI